MRIAVVGAGRAGTACALGWALAGHDIVAVAGGEATEARAAAHLPGVPVLPARDAPAGADVVVLGVPDGHIASVATSIAGAIEPGAWIAHLSGAVGLSALDGAGARRFAVHPLQTFPDVEHAIERLAGCTFAVSADDDEGFAVGEMLALDLGGTPFRLRDDLRPLYHAAAVLGSNDVVALSALALRAFEAAGVPDPSAALAPLQRATVDNIHTLGPDAALTGPVVRGDAGTVDANLIALAASLPDGIDPYIAMARAALDLAAVSGRLTDDERAAVQEVLDRWR